MINTYHLKGPYPPYIISLGSVLNPTYDNDPANLTRRPRLIQVDTPFTCMSTMPSPCSYVSPRHRHTRPPLPTRRTSSNNQGAFLMSPVPSTETFNHRRLIIFLLHRNLQSQEIDYFLIWVMIDNFLYYYSRHYSF